MFTTTFYSFKGGVGRTLALVNSAVHLAQNGRKVLIVDFDLEAPGIDSFALAEKSEQRLGIVDYVSEYLRSNHAPKVKNYVYQAQHIGMNGGSLTIMPAGRQDSTYSSRLNSIDWKNLYDHRDGYLMFEDLKAQWDKYISPDYVFIDSRTGHTDVGGICTRQLPEAVVMLFVPNAQNLNGLRKIVGDIRSEETSSRKKKIQTLFVASNIPNMDDEQQILERKLDEFKSNLGYVRLSARIHKYDSLSLLDQEIFTKDRPRTRLSKQYQLLVDEIVAENPKDREGALHFIRGLRRRSYWHDHKLSIRQVEKRIDTIHRAHDSDPEVLYELASDSRRRGQFEPAIGFLNELGESVSKNPDALLLRAECQQLCGRSEMAVADIVSLLKCEVLNSHQAVKGVHLLYQINPAELSSVAHAPAIESLDCGTRQSIARVLARCKDYLTAAVKLLESCAYDPVTSDEEREFALNDLALYQIGLRNYLKAKEIICKGTRPNPNELEITSAFNYGMAEWGEKGLPPHDMFQRVLELKDSELETDVSCNYAQCMVLSYWVVQQPDQAKYWLEVAKRRVLEAHDYDFSCWRYTYTSRSDFIKDLEEMDLLLKGKDIQPLYQRSDE